MGKDSDAKEETGFGFKDKAKAEETIELLKKHDLAYQRLTVRGLLGRAKRVLTLTKAEEKLKNIKEAMEVFEKWLEEYSKENPPKNAKPTADKKKPVKSHDKDDAEESDDEKDNGSKDESSSETVPGLGFKDKDKAEETIKLLEGRDTDYQRLAVKGLIGRAKRVLTCTRDKEKIKNIKDAVATFDKFLDNFEKKNMSKQNMSYMALPMLENFVKLAEKSKVTSDRSKAFLEAYKKVGGDYKKLRTLEDKESGITWDVIRNKELREHKNKIGDAWLFDDKDYPNNDHLKMIIWAYTPEEYKLKRIKFNDAEGDVKERKSSDSKRRHSGTSDDSSDEEKTKKKRK